MTDGGTKARMLDSAALLLRERGVGAVTVDAVLAHSKAPRGSVYHHFPGGRSELLLGALQQAGAFVSARLDRALAEGDARQAVESFVRFWKRALAESDFRAGCPVAAVVLDSRQDIPLAAETAREILDQWHAGLADILVADGVDPGRAARLATLCVAAVEGAIVLCRAKGDVTPLDDVVGELRVLLAAVE